MSGEHPKVESVTTDQVTFTCPVEGCPGTHEESYYMCNTKSTAEQLRDNAAVLLGPAYRTGQLPEAAIAGALQMAAREIDNLESQFYHLMKFTEQWDRHPEGWPIPCSCRMCKEHEHG